jgi:protein-S-isoprenylcysteine O-methyltransferase Ste14
MQRYLAVLTIALFLGIVLMRAVAMRRVGIRAVHFGNIDKTDFLVPPFALFYFYTVFAAAFDLPTVSRQEFFTSEIVSCVGVLLCLAGLGLFVTSIASFGKSFRVGIDIDGPGKLVTTGVFAFSRNPIYVAFGFILIGEFLVFPNWIPLVYIAAGAWLMHRQVLREEAFLKKHYHKEYEAYCDRVRRYL